MSKSSGKGVSKSMVQACTKNSHRTSTLQKELNLLEKQKTRQLKTMHKDAAKLNVPNSSPSPATRRPSTVGRTAVSASIRKEPFTPHKGAPSPRVASPGFRQSGTGKDTDRTPTSSDLLPRRRCVGLTGTASPGACRRSAVPAAVEVTVTKLESKILQPSNGTDQPHLPSSKHSAPEQQRYCLTVPQIVISDEAEEEHVSHDSKKSGSPRGTPSPGSPSSGSDSGSDHENSPPTSLPVPQTKRLRSNSMPMILLPSTRRPSSSRPSYTPPDLEPADDSHVSSPRDSISRFSGLLPARRRGSIPERWGSISERSRATRRGRKDSMEMERLLKDLRYGVLNRELMRAVQSGPSSPSLLEQQLEGLKDCRYLRMPSRDASEEDVSHSD